MTDAQVLDLLERLKIDVRRAHFNLVSDKLNAVKDEYVAVSDEVDAMGVERRQYISEGRPYPREYEFLRLKETQGIIADLADLLIRKLSSTFALMQSALELGTETADGDSVTLVHASDASEARIDVNVEAFHTWLLSNSGDNYRQMVRVLDAVLAKTGRLPR
jgi:hypothetical protein